MGGLCRRCSSVGSRWLNTQQLFSLDLLDEQHQEGLLNWAIAFYDTWDYLFLADGDEWNPPSAIEEKQVKERGAVAAYGALVRRLRRNQLPRVLEAVLLLALMRFLSLRLKPKAAAKPLAGSGPGTPAEPSPPPLVGPMNVA